MLRFLLFLVLLIFCLRPLPAAAADAKDIFGKILGEIGQKIERKRLDRQQKKLEPHLQACANGDVTACDAAARFPLNARGRRELKRLRESAVQRPQFEANWNACQRFDVAACDAALRYPGLSRKDRLQLRNWRRDANAEKHRQQAASRVLARYWNECLRHNKVAACTLVLQSSDLIEHERNVLTKHRSKLIQQKRLQEAAAAAAKTFNTLQYKCYSGNLQACNNALAHPHAIGDVKHSLNVKRREIQARRLKHERERAEQTQYTGFRSDCLDRGRESACQSALSHPLASRADRARYEQKLFELAPLPEQAMITLSAATISVRNGEYGFLGYIVGVLVALLIASGIIAVARLLTFSLSDHHELGHQPAPTEPEFAQAPNSSLFTFVPLTGHLPTDVRRVLDG